MTAKRNRRPRPVPRRETGCPVRRLPPASCVSQISWQFLTLSIERKIEVAQILGGAERPPQMFALIDADVFPQNLSRLQVDFPEFLPSIKRYESPARDAARSPNQVNVSAGRGVELTGKRDGRSGKDDPGQLCFEVN